MSARLSDNSVGLLQFRFAQRALAHTYMTICLSLSIRTFVCNDLYARGLCVLPVQGEECGVHTQDEVCVLPKQGRSPVHTEYVCISRFQCFLLTSIKPPVK